MANRSKPAQLLGAPAQAPSPLRLVLPALNNKDHPANNGGREGRTSWNLTDGGRLARLH